MLTEHLDTGLPIVTAWKDYLENRDCEQLLAAIAGEADQHNGFDLIFWLAIGLGDFGLVNLLWGRNAKLPPDDETWGLLACAIQDFGDAPHAIEWLLDHGANINTRGINDWTPLHFASNGGYLGVVKVLADRGADVNATTRIDGGWTPLMEACMAGHRAVAEFLLQNGADPVTRNTFGSGTARNIAAHYGHREIAAMLDAWCEPNAVSNRKRIAWKKRRREK